VERVRAYAGTVPYERARRKRQVWVEPLFGEAKAWHGLRRFRLRGLDKVNIEALLTATGQNLKRLLGRRGRGGRSGPSGAPGYALARWWCRASASGSLHRRRRAAIIRSTATTELDGSPTTPQSAHFSTRWAALQRQLGVPCGTFSLRSKVGEDDARGDC
jgi:hypothetical protein